MSAEAAAAAGQAAAERLMLDECEITVAATGPAVHDPITDDTVPPAPTVVYRGRCRARSQWQASTARAGEQDVTLRRTIVSLPAGTTSVPVGAVVRLTRSRDPEMVGRPQRVDDVQGGTFVTARRLICSVDLG